MSWIGNSVRSERVSYRLLSIFSVIGFCTILLILSLVLVSSRVEADVVVFDSQSYLEQGVQVAEDQAGIRYVQYEHIWSDFAGDVPDDAVAHTVALKFSWSPVSRTITEVSTVVEPEIDTGDTVQTPLVISEMTNVTESTYVTETLITEIPVITVVADETESTSSQSESVPQEEPSAVSVESTQTEETNVSEPHDPSKEADAVTDEKRESDTFEIPEGSTENESDVHTEEIPDVAPSEVSDTEGFEQVSVDAVYLLAEAHITELEASQMDVVGNTISTTEEIVIAHTHASSTEIVTRDVTTADISFEILYSVQGGPRTVLGVIQSTDMQDVMFDMSLIPIEDLPTLEIVARYVLPEESQIKIMFDALRLEVSYDPLVPVLIPELPPEAEPYFSVSSIMHDVTVSPFRAVVLERGGVYELWYTNTQRTPEVWNKAASHDGLDATVPIVIQERTLFWLDKSQQTLFGLTLDTQALSGVPFTEEPGGKVFILPFTNRKREQFEAWYDARIQMFEFRRLPKTPS
jgi:hypothetical protein